MASLYARGRKLWCRVKNEHGKWVGEPTVFCVGDEVKAQGYAERLQLKYDDMRAAGRSGPLTVAQYAVPWLEERKSLGMDWHSDRSRLDNHILPAIGKLPIADVGTPRIMSIVSDLRTKKKLASRTVRNVYSIMAALFRDAKLAGHVTATPCELDVRQLGSIVDKDPSRRAEAVFTHAEVEELISSEVIPADRRLMYGVELLTGTRPGETAALRWKHWDRSTPMLGKLTVSQSYNSKQNRAKSTKTDTVKRVPVHPTLALMLADWEANGWPAMMGRPPTSEDLIIPLPPSAAARRRSRIGESFRGTDYSSKRWREADLPALGWRSRQHYDMRATFISLSVDDGADLDIIEKRVTHTKKSRRAVDGYYRGQHWKRTCAEVMKLKIMHRGLATARATDRQSSSVNVVEAEGIEGTSNVVALPFGSSSSSRKPTQTYSDERGRTDRVAKLATAIAAAVLLGDDVDARRLARQIQALTPGLASSRPESPRQTRLRQTGGR